MAGTCPVASKRLDGFPTLGRGKARFSGSKELEIENGLIAEAGALSPVADGSIL